MPLFPVLDEIVRSFQSLGDAITGDTESARSRWTGWMDDSLLGNSVNVVVSTGAVIGHLCTGNTQEADKVAESVVNSYAKIGTMAVGSVAEAGGVCLQAATLGIPNPASGAVSGLANGIESAAKKAGKDWIDMEDLAKNSGKEFIKGAASSGGLIPYVATAVDCGIEGKPVKFDHNQELGSWGMNFASSAISAGTTKGVSKLSKVSAEARHAGNAACKFGAKSSNAVMCSVAMTTKFASSLIEKYLISKEELEKYKSQGYSYTKTVTDENDKEYFVYQNKAAEEKYVLAADFEDKNNNN